MNKGEKMKETKFTHLGYESIHQELQVLATLIDGLAWKCSAGGCDDGMARSLFHLCDIAQEQAERSREFFDRVHEEMTARKTTAPEFA